VLFRSVAGVVVVIQTSPSEGNPFPGDLHRMNTSFTSVKFLGTSAGFLCILLILFGVTHWYRRLRPAIWALASAVLSGYTVMLWKCLSLLVVNPSPGAKLPWLQYEFYMIFLFGNLVGAGQVHTMNCGLKLASPLLVVPIFYTLGMLVQIAIGYVFFDELNNFSNAFAMGRFWGGTIFLLVCIFFLTKFQTEHQKEQQGHEHKHADVHHEEGAATPAEVGFDLSKITTEGVCIYNL